MCFRCDFVYMLYVSAWLLSTMFYGRVPYFLSNDAKNGIGGTNECMYVCMYLDLFSYHFPPLVPPVWPDLSATSPVINVHNFPIVHSPRTF